MQALQQLKPFLKSMELQGYIEKALQILPNKEEAYQNYFGFNFENDQLKNIKAYFSFFRRLKQDELKILLPETKDFDQLSQRWKPTGRRTLMDTGCSFAIKVEKNQTATFQFHFRHPHIGALARLRSGQLELADFAGNQGTSYEYTPSVTDQPKVKKYYYFINSPIVEKTLGLFSEPSFPNHMIEYTETADSTKVIHWLQSQNLYQEYFSQIRGWENYKRFIEDFSALTGVPAQYPGIYQGGNTRAVYFNVPLTPENFSTAQIGYIDRVWPMLRAL